MKYALLSFALLFGASAVPASADTTAATPPTTATLICRPALANEHATAAMIGGSQSKLICTAVAMEMRTSDGQMHVIGNVAAAAKPSTGPDLSHALTPKAVNDAWVKYIDEHFHIEHSS